MTALRPLVPAAALTCLMAIVVAGPATNIRAAGPPAAPFSSPVITRAVPPQIAASVRAQALTLQGREFMANLMLAVTSPEGQTETYGGSAIRSQTDTSFQVSLPFPTAGTYQFVVTNPDGGTSPPFPFDVGKPTPVPQAPVIERVTPAEPQSHPEPQMLRIDGQRFESGLRAIVSDPIGTEIPEVRVSRVTHTAFQLLVRLDRAGTFEIVVTNPSGGVSNVFQIQVR